tara:strand:- start:108 stop:992 length:885 start_codon:yes stop_codon:yes gene_type:complete
MEDYYNSKCKELENDMENLLVYMCECAPYLHELSAITENDVADGNFPLVMKTNTKSKKLFEKFLVEVEGKIPDIPPPDPAMWICQNCGEELMEEKCTITCTSCGLSQAYIGSELSYKEEQEIEKHIVYSYKRENHFNEWLSQFQGIESTSIPITVIEDLRFELKKMRIKDLKDITHPKVRALLKKLRLNKYYEHVPYISTMLNGITPPRMQDALQEKLRLMFGEIQAPFEKNCPESRKNFLSYSYVLYKMCELLGEDQYLPCFPLLKSKEKLKQQDDIWKKITNDLQWQYIPTL